METIITITQQIKVSYENPTGFEIAVAKIKTGDINWLAESNNQLVDQKEKHYIMSKVDKSVSIIDSSRKI